jgi:archaellum component FlaC
MQQWVLDNIFSIITTIFGGTSFVAYLSEKRKRKIEEKQLTTDALKSMQEAYDKFTEDLLNRYNEISEELLKVKEELALVKKNLADEVLKYNTLQQRYEGVLKELEIVKNQ